MISLNAARVARDAGMQQALDHAVEVQDDWAEHALNALLVYIGQHPGEEFMTEKVRIYAHEVLMVPYPPHDRAWGGIIARAARQGLIRRIGIAPVKTPGSHMANASVWRAA